MIALVKRRAVCSYNLVEKWKPDLNNPYLFETIGIFSLHSSISFVLLIVQKINKIVCSVKEKNVFSNICFENRSFNKKTIVF